MTMAQTLDQVFGAPPIASGLFDVDASGAPFLMGGHCEQCDRYVFPYSESCPACLSGMKHVRLGGEGVIYSHTTVRTKPPYGLPQPYSVAFIDLNDAPLRIFALLDHSMAGGFRIGDRVKLKVGVIGHDGEGDPRARGYFTLKDSR